MFAIISASTADADISHKRLIYPNESDLGGSENLILDLRFDGTIFYTSNDNVDTIIGTGTESYIDSVFGQAMIFDSTDKTCIEITPENNFDLNPTDTVSITFVHKDAATGNGSILAKFADDDFQGWVLDLMIQENTITSYCRIF